MIVLVSGSLRAMSTNTAMLRTMATCGDDVVLYERMALLPHFDPDDDVDPLHPEVAHLRATIDAADGVVFCTPEYAGALPGSFKNALDWMVGSMALNAKPTAVVNVSAVGASKAQLSLRVVLTYLMVDFVEPACVHLPVQRQHVGAHGLIDDPDMRHQIEQVLTDLRNRARDQS
jgi:chromate reductase, NAD(P)H dehydrogenase (quinone)